MHYIVWNKNKTEGFITTCKFAAHVALTGQRHKDDPDIGVSAAAHDFNESYEGSELTIVTATVEEH